MFVYLLEKKTLLIKLGPAVVFLDCSANILPFQPFYMFKPKEISLNLANDDTHMITHGMTDKK